MAEWVLLRVWVWQGPEGGTGMEFLMSYAHTKPEHLDLPCVQQVQPKPSSQDTHISHSHISFSQLRPDYRELSNMNYTFACMRLCVSAQPSSYFSTSLTLIKILKTLWIFKKHYISQEKLVCPSSAFYGDWVVPPRCAKLRETEATTLLDYCIILIMRLFLSVMKDWHGFGKHCDWWEWVHS